MSNIFLAYIVCGYSPATHASNFERALPHVPILQGHSQTELLESYTDDAVSVWNGIVTCARSELRVPVELQWPCKVQVLYIQ